MAGRTNPRFVIPAQAGIQGEAAVVGTWIPACAGMTKLENGR